jgi:hypothetical protein
VNGLTACFVFEISNIKKKHQPYYFFFQHFMQNVVLLVQRLVWVAGWLWRFHKQYQRFSKAGARLKI